MTEGGKKDVLGDENQKVGTRFIASGRIAMHVGRTGLP